MPDEPDVIPLPKNLNAAYLTLYASENLVPSWDTVKKHYLLWRKLNGKPYRCDMDGCELEGAGFLWKGKPLVLILDHINGQKRDNNPHNLRLTCPNCDSQLPTKGGGNKGKIQDLAPNAYAVQGPDGKVDFYYYGEGGVGVDAAAVVQHDQADQAGG